MTRQSIGTYTFRGQTVEALRRELQAFANQLVTRLDEARGHRGTPTLYADMNANGKRVMALGDASAESDALRKDQTIVLNRTSGLYEAGNRGITGLATASGSTEAVPLSQILALIGDRFALAEATAPPPDVASVSALGDFDDGFASGSHTHGLESDATVTGLLTFDRDPGAPFAVTAISALVANLDSDKWDGQEYTDGTFTITATGMNAAVTGTARYVQAGQLVVLYIPALTGTSNAVTFTLTGLPAAITPTQESWHRLITEDNSVFLETGWARLQGASTTIELYSDVNGAGWTASGTKAVWYTMLAYHRN